MARHDGRSLDSPRPVHMDIGFHRMAEGSVLYRAGSTVVLCTASVEDRVPPFLEGKGKGWLTAEYQMHPRSNPHRREQRDGRTKPPSGRTQEIQRLVGRALRAAVDLDRLGERTIAIDCDILEADGGTRTASVTAGFVALAVALQRITKRGDLKVPVLREPIAAISVGCIKNGELALDLCYQEDSTAQVDLNVVATESHAIIEVQGTAEGEPVPRATMDKMVDLGLSGVTMLVQAQKLALSRAGVSLEALTAKKS
ncbi:MAG: ribonuclease PH [Polyangiaceae bacterium]